MALWLIVLYHHQVLFYLSIRQSLDIGLCEALECAIQIEYAPESGSLVEIRKVMLIPVESQGSFALEDTGVEKSLA